MAVSELAEMWLAAGVTKAAITLKRETSVVRKYIIPALGTEKVNKLTKARIQEVIDGWAAEGLAPSTVGSMAYCVMAMLNYAVDCEVIIASPAAKLRLPKKLPVKRPVLQPVQLQALADALGPDDACMMWIGVIGGLRWSECAGLTVGSFDQRAELITVLRSKTEAGRRTLPIPTWLVEDITALMVRRGLRASEPDALLFVSPTGGHLRYPNWLVRTWHPARVAAGLPDLDFHDLRSMSTTALVSAGVDLRTLQERMGWSSPTIGLQVYARSTPERHRRAADLVSEVLNPDRPRSAHTAPPHPL